MDDHHSFGYNLLYAFGGMYMYSLCFGVVFRPSWTCGRLGRCVARGELCGLCAVLEVAFLFAALLLPLLILNWLLNWLLHGGSFWYYAALGFFLFRWRVLSDPSTYIVAGLFFGVVAAFSDD